MLVGALEVEIRRRADLGPALRHAVMRHARIEPDVHDVGDLLVAARPRRRAASRRRGRTRRRCRPSRRAPRPLDAAPACAGAVRRSRGARTARAARPTRAGARCTSRGVLDHAVDALLAPVRRPSTLPISASAAARSPACSMLMNHCGRRAEDHRRLVAPAMRVAVADTPRGAAARRARPAPRRRACSRRRPSRRRTDRRRRAGSGHRRPPDCRRAGRTACRSTKSSWPWPGAVCTAPVPLSSVT